MSVPFEKVLFYCSQKPGILRRHHTEVPPGMQAISMRCSDHGELDEAEFSLNGTRPEKFKGVTILLRHQCPLFQYDSNGFLRGLGRHGLQRAKGWDSDVGFSAFLRSFEGHHLPVFL